MRSMIDNGIVLRSTDEPTPEAEDSLIQRTPSTSTSPRLEPRWRRHTDAAPAPTPQPPAGTPKLPLVVNLVSRAAPTAGWYCTRSAPGERRLAWRAPAGAH